MPRIKKTVEKELVEEQAQIKDLELSIIDSIVLKLESRDESYKLRTIGMRG